MGVIDAIWITAFVGGILTFISPCFLPIVPGYIGYIAGVEKTVTWRRVLHALTFTLGFAMVFALFGAGVGVLGERLTPWQNEIRIASGVLLVVFGILMLNILPIPFLTRDWQLPFFKSGNLGVGGKRANFLRSWAIGIVFAFGWTPCTGPVLGSVLTLAYEFGDWQRSTLLLAVYATGLGVPFVASALFLNVFLQPVRKFLGGRIGLWLQRFSGIVLIVFAIMLFTDSFARLAVLFE